MAKFEWLCRPIAHRAFHNKSLGVIENSPEAVKRALQKGYAIEVDVQPSFEGEPIVFHDATLERLTSASGPINQRSAEDLRQLSYKDSQTPDKILSLKDLMDLVKGQVPIIVEIKSSFPGAENFAVKVGQTIKSLQYLGPIAFMSFDPRQVRACARIIPTLPRGLTVSPFDDEDDKHKHSALKRFAMRHMLAALPLRPDFVAYDINGLPAFAPLFARRFLGVKLLTWTVRTPAQRERAETYTDAMIFEGFEI